jgi:hypothetical protein
MNMNHFNATVQDGTMVSTRRGFQVTKHKHKGTAFVNSSVQTMTPRRSPATTKKANISVPIIGEITFINDCDYGRKPVLPKPRSTRGATETKRLPGRRERSASTSTSSSGSTATPPPPDYDGFADESLSRDGTKDSLPPWASYKLPRDHPDSSKKLLFMALAFPPNKGYPFDEHGIQKDDLMKDPQQHVWLVKDPTSLHCALTLGALYDTLRSGKRESPNLNALTSQLCSIINRRLNDKEQSVVVRHVTINAIVSLAMIAGYQGKIDHWHVHMRGLLKLIDLAGGQDKLDIRTVNAIRK